MPMALVGPSARQPSRTSTSNFNETTAMSAAAAGLGMAYHATAPASHASQHAILAAAAATHNQGLNQGSGAAATGFYSGNNNSAHHQQQQQQSHHSNAQQPAQEVQPDRPIGYGAFGVVWYVSYSCHIIGA